MCILLYALSDYYVTNYSGLLFFEVRVLGGFIFIFKKRPSQNCDKHNCKNK